MHLRASQINGCSSSVDAGARHAKQAGQSGERLFAVAAWRDSVHFTEAEHAALALAKAVTRLNDRPDPIPDAVWDEAQCNFDEQTLAAVILTVAIINFFNRLLVPTRQVPGVWG